MAQYIQLYKALSALYKVGYTGPLDIEVNIVENPNRAYLDGKQYLENIISNIKG